MACVRACLRRFDIILLMLDSQNEAWDSKVRVNVASFFL